MANLLEFFLGTKESHGSEINHDRDIFIANSAKQMLLEELAKTGVITAQVQKDLSCGLYFHSVIPNIIARWWFGRDRQLMLTRLTPEQLDQMNHSN